MGNEPGRPMADRSPQSFGGLIRAIGILEIVGGVAGCAAVAWFYVGGHQEAMPGGDVQLALLPFGTLTTVGFALLRARQAGLWGSLVLQLSQALAWTAGETMWRFSAGPFLSLTLLNDTTSIFAGWDTSFGFGRVPENAPGSVSLNLIPVFIALALWRHLRRGLPSS